MTERPDFRRRTAAVIERIVSRNGAVGIQPQDLAQIGLHVLRGIELLPLAGADPKIPVRAEDDPMAVMTLTGDLRYLTPEDLHVSELSSIAAQAQPGARDGRSSRVTVTGLDVAHINQVVVFEVGVKNDVAEATLAAMADLG